MEPVPTARMPAAVYEVPIEGDFDLEAANDADVVGYHVDGKAAPLVLIRTWDDEVPKQRNLARHLGPDQPIYSIAPPSHEKREDYPGNTDEWSDFCLARFRELPLDGALRLGGWSFGGVIALEMAEKLHKLGRETELIVMMDTRLPKFHAKPRKGQRSNRLFKFSERLHHYVRLPKERQRSFLRRRLRRWASRRGARLKRRLGLAPSRRSKRAKPQEVAGQQGVHLTSHGVPMTLLKVAVRTAYVRYRCHNTKLPIAQYWTRESLKAAKKDATLGWGRHVRGSFETVGVLGEHRTMFEDEFVPHLARQLRHSLRLPEPEARSRAPRA